MNHFEKKFRECTGLNFQDFYKENRPKLVWHLTKWTKSMDIAEDFAEEAFMQSLKKIDTYQGQKSQVHTWLYTIAINLVKKDYADRQKLPSISMDKELGNNASMCLFLPYHDGRKDKEDYDETCRKSDIIKEAIHSLPDKQDKYKKVLIMREINNMAYKEISDHLQLNLSTVKSQIKKGREIIAKKVERRLKYIDENGIK